jgi:hemolysin III
MMAGAVGIAFFIVVLLGNNDRSWAAIGVGLYLFGMLGSYLASTIYHALRLRNPWRERMRKWDHAAIYWHIAGSYSPITLIAMRDYGYWGWTLFTFVWACAIIGTLISFIKLKEHSNIETACFVIMGLSVLAAFKPLVDTVSVNAFVWIVLEGVFYITGAVFYSFNKTKYMHTVFHFCVLAGSICHIVAVWDILIRDIF